MMSLVPRKIGACTVIGMTTDKAVSIICVIALTGDDDIQTAITKAVTFFKDKLGENTFQINSAEVVEEI